jgi:SNF2 family DNA or RNA helicase
LLSLQKKTGGNRKVVVNTNIVTKKGINLLIIDELSKCKQGSTQQSKLIHAVSQKVDRVLGLTATPAPNSLLDLFSQAKCVDLGRSLGTYISKYKDQYFYTEPYKQYTWLLKRGAKEAIYKLISDIVIQRRDVKVEYAMPELSIEKIFITIPDDALVTYKQMERDFIVEYENGTIRASNAAVKTLKLRQISNGALYTYNSDAQEEAVQQLLFSGGTIMPTLVRDTILLHDAKAKALARLAVETKGTPLLVFYNFEHDIDLIKREMGDVIVLNKEKNSDEMIQYWNDGRVPLMLLHPRSGGHGLNLQFSGANVCWFSPEWSHELHEQGNRRVWRQGNPNTQTTIYYLLCNDTIDEHILESLKAKALGESNLLKGVAAYIKTIAK